VKRLPLLHVYLQALGMCCNRGPLVGSWTTAQFVMLYILPIYPREGELDDGNSSLGPS